jgi:transcriptional regulator of acetoin/glycerol metabolism
MLRAYPLTSSSTSKAIRFTVCSIMWSVFADAVHARSRRLSMAAVRAFGVRAALEQARWKVSRAADALGVDRHVIKRLMTK